MIHYICLGLQSSTELRTEKVRDINTPKWCLEDQPKILRLFQRVQVITHQQNTPGDSLILATCSGHLF